jgi:hypothetical protein
MELDDDHSDLPPLELATPAPRAPAGPAAARGPAIPRAPAPPGSLAEVDEDGDGEGLAPELALDAPPSSRAASALTGATPAPSSAGARGPASSSGQRPAPAPPPGPPPRPPILIDPIDVVAFANYGPAPRVWFEAPLYAIRVMQRQRELQKDLVRARKLHVDAEDALVERMARTAEALRGRIDAAHPAMALFGQLGRYDELTHTRSVALHETSRQYAEQLAQVDERISAEEEARSKLARLVQDAELELGRLSAERARADAKSKRLEIELRSAHDAARIAAGPDAKFAPPEHAHRIAALEAEKASRAAEMVPIMAAWTEAAELVRRRQGDEREARKKVSALRDERKRIEQTAEHQLEVRSEGARQAERERFSAYAEVTRAVLVNRPDDLTEAERAAIDAAEKRATDCERDTELHVRALGAADHGGLRQGVAFILGAFILVLLLVATVIVRSGPSEAPVRSAPAPSASAR